MTDRPPERSAADLWWCVEVEGPGAPPRQIGCVRDWQDVLDRAAGVRRLGDICVPGYTGLFRVRGPHEDDHFFLVCERPCPT